MSLFEWSIADTESGKKSHLSETGVYIFCAPLWGKVDHSVPYEGQTSYRGKVMCKTCEKAAMARLARQIARQRGDETSALWIMYQMANGHIRLQGKGAKPAPDVDAPVKKPRLKLIAGGAA